MQTDCSFQFSILILPKMKILMEITDSIIFLKFLTYRMINPKISLIYNIDPLIYVDSVVQLCNNLGISLHSAIQ
jgi:hypothetical protein